MDKYIVLGEAYDFDRSEIEDIEGIVFKDLTEANKYYAPRKITIYSVSEFVDASNDEHIDLDNSWITYIHIK